MFYNIAEFHGAAFVKEKQPSHNEAAAQDSFSHKKDDSVRFFDHTNILTLRHVSGAERSKAPIGNAMGALSNRLFFPFRRKVEFEFWVST